MKYFSMFSGVGGFEKGILQAFPNAECVGYSEIDKYAIATYEHNFKGHKNYGNATTIQSGELPEFDLLVGGFPCQAFSIAGKRYGFQDTRGTLFFDIARILANKRPRHLVLENVKGLLSHDNGKTFQTILGVLSELGYTVEWQVLNSKDFGVPQSRERIYIVGHLGAECKRKVFPFRFDSETTVTTVKRKRITTGRARNFGSSGQLHAPDEICSTLTSSMGTGGNNVPTVLPVLTPDRIEKRQNGRRFKTNGEPSFTLTAQDRHGVAVDMTRRAKNGYKDRKDNISSTITATYYKGMGNAERPGVKNGLRIRRLTPVECERLQGFPDGWTVGSDTQRYKQMGNAVTVNVVEAIIRQLKDCLC